MWFSCSVVPNQWCSSSQKTLKKTTESADKGSDRYPWWMRLFGARQDAKERRRRLISSRPSSLSRSSARRSLWWVHANLFAPGVAATNNAADAASITARQKHQKRLRSVKIRRQSPRRTYENEHIIADELSIETSHENGSKLAPNSKLLRVTEQRRALLVPVWESLPFCFCVIHWRSRHLLRATL